MSTPKPRNCWIRRQTSERLEEISWAIFVPLITTVACFIRRPHDEAEAKIGRLSWYESAAAARDALRDRIGLLLAMRELSANPAQTTITRPQRACSSRQPGASE